MAKEKTVFVCSACGYETPRWMGKCPGCNAWNTLEEQAPQAAQQAAPVKANKQRPGTGASAMRLSEMKARAIWDKHPGAVVIGSDQVADLNGVKLGKPHTHENAVRQLKSMQGHDVVFTTALCVIDAEGRAERVKSQTTIRMRTLSDAAIEAYVEREKPFDCAGAAKIERLGIALMESVKSDDPTSLIGLPLMALTTLLTRAGVEVLPGLDA